MLNSFQMKCAVAEDDVTEVCHSYFNVQAKYGKLITTKIDRVCLFVVMSVSNITQISYC